MAFDVQTLNDAARCAECLSPNQKQNVLLYLLNGILLNGASGGGVHDLLSASHPDTLPAAVLRGSLIVGNSTPLWSELTIGAAGTVLTSDGTDASWAAPASAGTVTSFSAGNLAPLFTTSVATASTTPALTFSLSTQAANLVFAGPASGAAAGPTFRSLVALDLPATTVVPGTYGSATQVGQFTVDQQGRITAATDVAITFPGGFSGFANPTALVGLAAINGVATTAMRSDGAPALDQAIVPTWTGAHTWTPPANTTPITVSGYSLTGANAQSVLDLSGTWNTSGIPTAIKLNITNTASSASSLLLDLQRDSISRFRVLRTGYGVLTRQEADISSGGLSLQKRGTTGDATAAISNASNITAFSFEGWDGSVYVQGAVVKTVATEVWTGSAHGTKMVFGVAAIGGSTAVTLMELTSTALTLSPYGASAGNTSEIRFLELVAGGTNYTGFKAPDAIAVSEIYVLPNAAPAANRFLQAAAVAGGVSALSWAQVSLTADVSGILPVANGGSGTSTAFTLGSVIFAGAAGVYTEDNANLFYDDSANRLIANQLRVEIATSATVGGIYFGASRAIHSFGTSNIFVGVGSGNLTLTGNSNSCLGVSTGSLLTSGSQNAFFGTSAGQKNTTGEHGTFFGAFAGTENTTGNDNSFFGRTAGTSNTTGGNNCFFGSNAGASNTTGTDNNFFGVGAGQGNTTGTFNFFFGRAAGLINTTGSENFFFGFNAGQSNIIGVENIYFGSSSGMLATGSRNILIGFRAGDALTTGNNNVLIGYDCDVPTATSSNTLVIGNLIFGTGLDAIANNLASGNIGIGVITPLAKFHVTNSAAATIATIIKAAAAQSANLTEWQSSAAVANTVINAAGNINIPITTSTVGIIFQNAARLIHTFGTNNFFFGSGSGNFTHTSSGDNVALGVNTLAALTTGNSELAIGTNALAATTTGNANIGIGTSALLINTTGSNNVALGVNVLVSNIVGIRNVGIGNSSLLACTSDRNVGIGYFAGANITSGMQNIIIGYLLDAPSATDNGQLTIGNLIFGTGIVGTGTTLASGGVGIRVSAPTAKLHLCAGAAGAASAPLKFNTGTSMTAAEAGAVEFTTDDLFFTITTGAARKRLLMADATAGLTSGKMPIATTNGRLIDLTASSAYTPTNVTTDRSYDANATTLDELSDVVGTMIADLQTKGILG